MIEINSVMTEKLGPNSDIWLKFMSKRTNPAYLDMPTYWMTDRVNLSGIEIHGTDKLIAKEISFSEALSHVMITGV